MIKTVREKSNNLREERNSELLRRMENGEPLSSFNSFSSWYPPRPIIEKNSEAVARLYGKAPTHLRGCLENVGRLDTNNTDDVVEEDLRPLRLA